MRCFLARARGFIALARWVACEVDAIVWNSKVSGLPSRSSGGESDGVS
jgi:hypothetical protein